jgi:hypothetical protein
MMDKIYDPSDSEHLGDRSNHIFDTIFLSH